MVLRDENKARRAILEIASALCEAIEASGKQGIDEGSLYAAVMGMLSLDQFKALLNVLAITGKIERASLPFHWRGRVCAACGGNHPLGCCSQDGHG